MKIVIPISLDTDRDRDILRRLRLEPRGMRSAVVRQALEEHYHLVITLQDIYRLLVELRQLGVRASASLAVGPDEPLDEPEDEDLAAALENLGR